MGVFKDSQQFYDTVGELLYRAALDPDIGSHVARTESIIQFRYTDPDAQITLNAKDRPTQPDAYFDVFFGPSDFAAGCGHVHAGRSGARILARPDQFVFGVGARTDGRDWDGHARVAARAGGGADVSVVLDVVARTRAGRLDLEVKERIYG